MIPIVDPTLEEYCRRHTSAPDPLLDELAAYTRSHCKLPQMLTGPVEGTFLRLLVQLTGAWRVLEIGTFTGYSALSMAAALPDGGEITTCEIDTQHARIAQSFFDHSPHGRKITIRLAPALETVSALKGEFDFVFLDADKENYVNYYEAVLPKLKPGGLLVADNVLWSGKVLDPREKTDQAIVAFNDRVARDARVEQVMLSVRDGILLVRKR